jgi:hypothetical protein
LAAGLLVVAVLLISLSTGRFAWPATNLTNLAAVPAHHELASAPPFLAGTGVLAPSAQGFIRPDLSQPPPQLPAHLHVIVSTADRLVVEFAAPDPVVEQITLGSRRYSRVAVPGLGWLSEPGRPQVPVAWMLLGLPPGTHAELRQLADDGETLPLPRPPAPAPVVASTMQEMGAQQPDNVVGAAQSVTQVLPTGLAEGAAPLVYAYDPSVPPTNPYPSAAAAIGAPARWRSQVMAILRVYPIQVVALQRAVRFHRRLRVEVRFVPDASPMADATDDNVAGPMPTEGAPAMLHPPSEGVLESLLLRLLANAESARAWRLAPDRHLQPSGPPDPAAIAATVEQRWWKLQVRRQGLYHIGCNQLGALLGTVAPDLAGVHLYFGAADEAASGREVAARQVDANRNGRCDDGDGDAIEFWGQPGDSHYDAGIYYWLTVGPSQGLRMALQSSAAGGASPAPLWRTLLAEQNRYYRPAIPAMDAESGIHDHWFWDFLAPGSSTVPAAREFPFTLAGIASPDTTPGVSAVVSVTLAGLDGAHQVSVSVNGVWLGELAWQGRLLYVGALAIPPGVLHPGENTLRLVMGAAQVSTHDPISASAASSPVLVDCFTLTYHVSQPAPLDAEGSPLVFGVEPGNWQVAFAVPADRPVTMLDIGDPLRPIEIAPVDDPGACSAGACGATWGIDGDQAGVYAAIAAEARFVVDSIAEDTPSQWRSPANGADYVLITHPTLWAAAERLAELRRRQGLRVALVDVQDVYDEFSGGQVDAAAIRAFLAYAYSYWQPPAPVYVLLLGDGTFDPRGYCTAPGACPEITTEPGSTLIPPYLANVDAWLGETATDNGLVAFEPGNNLPWLAIGRLPANDAVQAQVMVDKILAYEDAAPAEADDRTTYLALVSDNAYAVDGTLDPAGDFWQASDAAAALAQQAATAGGIQLAVQRLYLNVCDPARFPYCLLPDPPYRPYTDAPGLITGLATWLNEPSPPRPRSESLLVHYAGHGSIGGWAGQPVLLQGADVAQLGLTPRLPMILDITCYTGYFHFPGLPSLAEAWLSAPQHGAVAVIASSGLGLAEAHASLDFVLLAELAGNDDVTAGQALLAAKLAAAASGSPEDVDTFHLFGDPAMPLRASSQAAENTPTPTPGPPITLTATPTSQTPAATPVPTPGRTQEPATALYLPWLAANEER